MTPEFTVNDFAATTPTPKFVIKRLPNQQSKSEVRERNYRREMLSEDGHRELASTLHECVATVVLSGYASRLYDEVLFRDWYRVELAAATSQGGSYEVRTEVLWSNRPLRRTSSTVVVRGKGAARNETSTNDAVCNETRCPVCAGTLRQAATGRRRIYCSPACRVRAHRRAAISGE